MTTEAAGLPAAPEMPAAGSGVAEAGVPGAGSDLPAGGGTEDLVAEWTGPSLSPSRAGDFKTCPLLFRFRTIDRLPERPSADQLRGTLVHAVLERLFDLPAAERTPTAADDLVVPQWEKLLEASPELSELFADQPGNPDHQPSDTDQPADTRTGDAAGVEQLIDGQLRLPPGPASAEQSLIVSEPAAEAGGIPVGVTEFLGSARRLLEGYFSLEDPRRLEPAERESLISAVVDGELRIRGYIDRLDVSPDGRLRVVDYKTGGAPREAFEARALFQLKFYALVLWRTRGVVPRVLRLIYLKDAEVCDYTPDVEELRRFERTVVALWRAIEQATAARDFRPRPSRLCGWCHHQALCPAFGGTPPPFPEPPAPPATATPDLPIPALAGPSQGM